MCTVRRGLTPRARRARSTCRAALRSSRRSRSRWPPDPDRRPPDRRPYKPGGTVTSTVERVADEVLAVLVESADDAVIVADAFRRDPLLERSVGGDVRP